MSAGEEKIDEISDEYGHYDGEDNNLQRTRIYNTGTGVERLQTIMEGKLYKSLSKQLQFLINNVTCVKKKIQ